MHFDQKLEKQILWLSFFSFMGPPMGWFMIIMVSGLVDISGALRIMANPFFYVYVVAFLSYSIYSKKRFFRKVREAAAQKEYSYINSLYNSVPRNYFIFTATYGFFGPPAVTLGLGFSTHTFIVLWVLGPVVISMFSIPFFNQYLTLINHYLQQVPLEYSRFFSLKKRLDISIAYLVIGALLMVSIVFYNMFYNHIHGQEVTIAELILKLTLFVVLGSAIVVIPLLMVSRDIRRSLLKTVNYLKTFREGRLGERIVTTHRDEFGLLMGDANQLSANFNQIIGEMKQGAGQIANLGNHLREASTQISRDGERQLEASTEIGNHLKDILSDARLNTENASELNTKASDMIEQIRKGSEEMNALNERITIISGKLQSLDEITRQTDLLALNAAVEAANAGQFGSGFGVVANEVRRLAERSKGVADEINRITTEIVGLARSSREKFEIFSTIISENARICSVILSSSGKQKDLTGRIDHQMDGFTDDMRKLSELTEGMNRNALTLEEISRGLKSRSDYFRIKH